MAVATGAAGGWAIDRTGFLYVSAGSSNRAFYSPVPRNSAEMSDASPTAATEIMHPIDVRRTAGLQWTRFRIGNERDIARPFTTTACPIFFAAYEICAMYSTMIA